MSKIEDFPLKKMLVSLENDKKYLINYKRVPPFLLPFYTSTIKDIITKRGSHSARQFNSHIVRFWDFCKEQNIDCFEKFNPQITNYFIAYLNTSFTKDRHHSPIKGHTKRAAYSAVYLFFALSRFFYPDEFKTSNYFNGDPFKVGDILTESIPEPVLIEIKKNLLSHDDIYTKTYILLALNYGMRYSEIIGLKEDCLVKNELGQNKYDLHFFSGKINEHRTLYSINNTIAGQIQELIDYSAAARSEFGKKDIFVKKNVLSPKGYMIYDNTHMNKKINAFLKLYKIKHPSGEEMKLTTHMFRRTVPEMFSKKGVDIYVAQVVLGHKSIHTTRKYYDRTNEYEYEKSMGEAINTITVFKDISEINMSIINENPEKFRIIEEGYCTNSDTVNSGKLCPQLKGRGNCYGCPSMVTTPDYLPFFYKQLDAETKNLNAVQNFGLDVARHYEWKIGIIKEIISKLESIA